MFQSAPALVTPGNGRWRGGRRPRSGGFNPPRRSSRRGTLPRHLAPWHPGQFQSAPALVTPGNLTEVHDVTGHGAFQSAPALVTPGNLTLRRTLSSSCRFQSAPALVTPGNAHDDPSALGVVWVSIRPGARHAGEHAIPAGPAPVQQVSIRPGARHAGERPPTAPRRRLRFVSIRPGARHAGERPTAPATGTTSGVSIRPGARHAGEPRRGSGHSGGGRFNPPRRSSRRGTRPPRAAWTSPSVSIRPGARHAGELQPVESRIGAGRFQSAPALVTPGNADPPELGALGVGVSIRPGARHAGERRGHGPAGLRRHVSIRPGARHAGERSHPSARTTSPTGFNPPRRSSRRGTLRRVPSPRRPAPTMPFQSAPALVTPGNARNTSSRLAAFSSFNPPRRSSRRGTLVRECRPDVVIVSIRPGARHAGELGLRVPGPGHDRVSIRPGARHAGERDDTAAGINRTCFNPPRRSSRRGTRGSRCPAASPGFNPPRRSSRRGTGNVLRGLPGPSVSIRPGARHAGEHRPRTARCTR